MKIARRLKLPRELLKRAHRYLKRRQKRAPEMAQLQRLREEAEKAKEDSPSLQHEAERQREELRQKQSANSGTRGGRSGDVMARRPARW